MHSVNCDICGKNEYKILGAVKENILVKCLNCGHYYMPKRFDKEELEKIYGFDYFHAQYVKENEKAQNDYITDKPNVIKFAEKRYDTVSKYIEPGKVLDIGCATGFYLEHAKLIGWDVYGIEISKYASDYAKKLLQTGNIQCKAIEDVEFDSEEFDLITMWLVFEHMNKPMEVLGKINRWLKKNGILGIKVPNIDGVTGRSNLEKWISQRPEDHMCDYTPDTLERICSKAGFTILEYETEGIYIDRATQKKEFIENNDINIFFTELSQKSKIGDSLVMFLRKD